MRKSVLVLVLMLLPTIALAQGYVRVSSVYGPVEWKTVSAAHFVPLQQSTQMVRVGDEIRTGPGGTLMLELADGSYMVVSENSTLTIQEFWTPNLHNLVKLVMGKVRFYIQRLGGKPNPYSVQTPTALIAVRGTTFEVTVEDVNTIVTCIEGRVAVETIGYPDREVILETGSHTLVRPGLPPVTPVAVNEPLIKNRVIPVVRKDADDLILSGKNAPSTERLIRDNDRRNRTADPLQSPGSRTTTDVQRAKPTLRYPE
jgi:hypothetical protein